MSNREYAKTQIDTLPDNVVEKIVDYILYQRYCIGLFDNDDDYLASIPGMIDSIKDARNAPESERLDSIGWNID